MTRADKPLALTLGDPAGIGPDITLLAFEARFRDARFRPSCCLATPTCWPSVLAPWGLAVKIKTIGDASAAPPVFAIALPVLPISGRGPVVAGHPDPANAGNRPAVDRKIRGAWSRAEPQAPW